jgi:hypothetical protein
MALFHFLSMTIRRRRFTQACHRRLLPSFPTRTLDYLDQFTSRAAPPALSPLETAAPPPPLPLHFPSRAKTKPLKAAIMSLRHRIRWGSVGSSTMWWRAVRARRRFIGSWPASTAVAVEKTYRAVVVEGGEGSSSSRGRHRRLRQWRRPVVLW